MKSFKDYALFIKDKTDQKYNNKLYNSLNNKLNNKKKLHQHNNKLYNLFKQDMDMDKFKLNQKVLEAQYAHISGYSYLVLDLLLCLDFLLKWTLFLDLECFVLLFLQDIWLFGESHQLCIHL